MSSPILKILAANHMAATADATPMTRLSATCQNGGGVVDASRTIIANVLTGGTRLMATLKVESGRDRSASAKNHGAISASMIGVISDCASRISFTAAPTAAKTDANTR